MIVCENCKTVFDGRSNRRTCSVRCRRLLENRRRFWDHRAEYMKRCEIQAGWQSLSVEQRAYWALEGEKAKERLIKAFGPRP
jgi:hypothetical protein